MAEPFSGRSFLRTLGLVGIAMAVLSAADVFLANMERAESRVGAARLFAEGQALMERGKNAQAIERIKEALAIERGNRDYQRTLAEAQLAGGQTAGAEATLGELLQSDSTDGLANLIMGRVLVKEGRFAEAVSYYYRAIYGRWKENAQENRLRARFELVDLLAERNSKEELLAELLPIQEEAPHDLKTQMRIGQLFLQAGSPARAADVFRGMLRAGPPNADAYAGLGEAEFARANYRAAVRDFQAALRLAPDDQAARQRLDACNELLALDPMLRGLGPAERFRRSLKLVELTRDQAGPCLAQNPPSELQELSTQADKALAAHVSAVRQSEVSESNLDLAEQLWQARRRECQPPPATDSPLALVMARLAQ